MRFTQPPPSCATPLSANEILVPAKTEPVIVEDKFAEVNINIYIMIKMCFFILSFIRDDKFVKYVLKLIKILFVIRKVSNSTN